jgi:endonuclease/exonuclease/phosphatase family metal-dependent hydrolase
MLGTGVCLLSKCGTGTEEKTAVVDLMEDRKGSDISGDTNRPETTVGDSAEKDIWHGSTPLHLMTLNLRTGLAMDGENAWKHRESTLLNLLQQEAPDLIGTQEGLLFQLMAIEDRFPRYAWVGTGRNGTDFEEFCAVFYHRERFDLLDSGTFWLSDTPDIPDSQFSEHQLCVRIVTWAFLADRTDGTRFYLFNTHFDTKSEDNLFQRSAALLARKIREIAGDHQVFVTGDFNTAAGNDAWRILTGDIEYEGTSGNLLDPWTTLGLPEEGTFHKFSGVSKSGHRIDWVLYTAPADPTSAWVNHYQEDGRYPTDHFPVQAMFQVPIR